MLVNKYENPCGNCAVTVPVGAGYAANEDGQWVTKCADCAAPELAREQSRQITPEGEILMPFERDALPFLRQIANWNPNKKCWTVDPTKASEAIITSVAKRLGLDDRRTVAEAPATAEPTEKQLEGLYPYQRDGVRRLVASQRLLLADDQGLGKTAQTLRALGDGSRVLLVARASLLRNWQAEAVKWAPEYKFEILSRKTFRMPEPGEIVAVSYDSLPKVEQCQKFDLSGVTLVADEAHYCKNFRGIDHKKGSQRAKRLAALSERAERVWLLTGTPLLNKPGDLFGLLGVGQMAKTAFGSWWRFQDAFNGYQDRWGAMHWGTPKPHVPALLESVMLRRLKSEVLLDLPEKRFEGLVVNGIPRQTRKELDDLDEEFGGSVRAGKLPPFSEMSEVRAALAESRIDAMLGEVEAYEDAGEPLLVFSAHRSPIDRLAERDGWRTITGDTDQAERQQIVNDFQAGRLHGVGLTISAGGVGLTLTRASHVLFVDLDWTPALNTQAEDRVHRIGQRDSVLIRRMVSDHPLDQHVQKLLVEKSERSRLALDGEGWSYPVPERSTPEDLERAEARARAAVERSREREAREQAEWAEERIRGALGRERGKALGMPELPLTDARKALIREGMLTLAESCDGALRRDGAGFSKPDAALAAWIEGSGWTSEEAYRLAEAICWRYSRTQLTKAIWE